VYTKEETDNAIAEAIKHVPSGDLTQYLTKTDAETTYAKISSVDSIASLLAEEVTRAKAAEEKNANDIIQINALLNTISDLDDITSLKELAIWVEEYGAKAIAENTEAIESLVTRVSANELAINTTLPNILAEAKKYTDDTMVKADDTSIQNNDGTFSVKAVSTDLLVQGEYELYLDGGSSIYT
jgi:hypothetical protein